MERRLDHFYKAEPDRYRGQWIKFTDWNGLGYAQPDYYVWLTGVVLVFESKLTQCNSGYSQMLDLYFPLLSDIYMVPCIGVQVCKGLVSDRLYGGLITDLTELEKAPPGSLFTWHFLG